MKQRVYRGLSKSLALGNPSPVIRQSAGPYPLAPLGWLYTDPNGVLWQKKNGGVFGATNYDELDITTFKPSGVTPATESFTVALSVERKVKSTAPYALLELRQLGVGFVVVVQIDGTCDIGVSKDGTLRYRVQGIPYSAILILFSWNHITSTLSATWDTGNSVVNTTTSIPALGAVGKRFRNESGGQFILHAFAFLPFAETLAEMQADIASNSINLSAAQIHLRPSMDGVTSGTVVKNYGTLGGTATLNDPAVSDWWGERWYRYLKMLLDSDPTTYRQVSAGLFEGGDGLTLGANGTRDPNTTSATYFFVMYVGSAPLTASLIFGDRLSGVGARIFHSATTGKLSCQQSKDGSTVYICELSPPQNSYMRLCVVWDHSQNKLLAVRSGETLVDTATSAGVSSSSGYVISASQLSNLNLEYYAVMNSAISQSQAEDWCNGGALPSGVKPEICIPSVSAGSGVNVPNLGSLGGNFTLTDSSPTAWRDSWRIPAAIVEYGTN